MKITSVLSLVDAPEVKEVYASEETVWDDGLIDDLEDRKAFAQITSHASENAFLKAGNIENYLEATEAEGRTVV